jgi:type II secretory ATPase GspE/PulE/Tfp pilus assembly ATPase PilB-like protein
MLRRVLRQDPNVIMVGEIRDMETAELALRAALTGHIIFSTLHTNDSISAVSRLANMGIERFLIASVFRYVIAQRLVRKVCPHCKEEKTIPDFFKKIQAKYGITSHTIYEEKGCEHCNYTGFSGRTVIAEIFIINAEIERMIGEHRSIAEITAYAQKNGMKTMEYYAVRKVSDGITTINEVLSEALICNPI